MRICLADGKQAYRAVLEYLDPDAAQFGLVRNIARGKLYHDQPAPPCGCGLGKQAAAAARDRSQRYAGSLKRTDRLDQRRRHHHRAILGTQEYSSTWSGSLPDKPLRDSVSSIATCIAGGPVVYFADPNYHGNAVRILQHGYLQEKPPSTGSSVPVVNPESSVLKNSAARETSSGSPSRFSATRSLARSACSGFSQR